MRILLLPTLSCLLLLFLTSCESVGKQYTNDQIKSPEDVGIVYTTPGLDQPPVIKRGKIPSHPDSQRWEKGYAKATFTVNAKGKTENIKIVESKGKYFGGNTAYAIRFWKFEPALESGQPVPCDAVFEIWFRGLHFGGVNE